jgi:arsenate reductase (thioredoxin)
MLAGVRWQKAFSRNMLQRNSYHLVQGRNQYQTNPLAIQVMEEVGINISKQKPKDLSEDMMRNSDKIINMGCMDDKNFCPTLFIPKVIDWNIEDPKGKPIEKVREIRDEIERRIKELAADISVTEEENNS